ncbi:MAG: ABC transporter ATP-binding protein [Phycisphaerae bacterium]|nr:ABC transporter ATP-binding protein [Phycisphaerae bacterium]
MIRIREMFFQYPHGDFRMHITDMNIARNEKIAVLGPSGCGKSTFLHLLAGIIVPDCGSVLVDDIDIAKFSDARRRDFRNRKIGFIFQQFELIDYLSVLENVLLPLRISRGTRLNLKIKNRALELLEATGLADKYRRRPGQLSHGERQRVAIARAMINNPAILLADEPTGNLDPDNKRHVKNLIFKCTEESQATLIFITHDHDLLEGFDGVIDLQQILQGDCND